MYKTKLKWNVAGGLIHFENITASQQDICSYYRLHFPLIQSVYDSHAGLPWNGGRYAAPFAFSMEESVRRIAYYNENGMSFNIAFSNRLIQKSDLEHEDCNWFLEQCHKEGNGVVVANELLHEYIRTTYPKYKIIASIGFCRKDRQFYRNALNKYDIVVLHPDLNRDFSLIRTLDTQRLEILVNENCIDNCPFRQEHSLYISKILKAGVLYFRNDSNHLGSSCLARANGISQKRSLRLSLEDIAKLADLGVRHFKIQGREHPYEKGILRDLRDYIVRNEIHQAMRQQSIKKQE